MQQSNGQCTSSYRLSPFLIRLLHSSKPINSTSLAVTFFLSISYQHLMAFYGMCYRKLYTLKVRYKRMKPVVIVMSFLSLCWHLLATVCVKLFTVLHLSGLTVNSSHGELVTCDEFTFSPKSELVTDCHRVQWTRHTVITKQWTRHKDCHRVKWTRHAVISSHWRRGDLVTHNSLRSSQGLSQHLPHWFTHM